MTPEQYKNLEDITDMMRRVALIARKESTTATRQLSLAEEQWYGKSKMIAAATRPLMTYQRIMGDKLNDFISEKAKRKFIEAALSPETGPHLAKIKRLNLNTEKGIRQVSTFLSLVLGGEFQRHGLELPKTLQKSHGKKGE
jgi:hypothetical protein